MQKKKKQKQKNKKTNQKKMEKNSKILIHKFFCAMILT